MDEQTKQELFFELLTLGYNDDVIPDLIDGCSDRNMLFEHIKFLNLQPTEVSDKINPVIPEEKKVDENVLAKDQEAALKKNKNLLQTEQQLPHDMMDLDEKAIIGKSVIDLRKLNKYEANVNQQGVPKGFSWNKIPKANSEFLPVNFKLVRAVSRRQEKLESANTTFDLTNLSNKKVSKEGTDNIPELSLKFKPLLSPNPNKVSFFLSLINTNLNFSPKPGIISDSSCITASLSFLTQNPIK